LCVSLVISAAVNLCVASQRVCFLFRYRLIPETFGYILVHIIRVAIGLPYSLRTQVTVF